MSPSNSDVTHAPDQVKQFNRDGYTVIRNFLGKNRLNDITEGINDLITNRLNEIPREHVFYEDIADPQSLKQIQHLDRYAPVLREPFQRGVFKELAEKLASDFDENIRRIAFKLKIEDNNLIWEKM